MNLRRPIISLSAASIYFLTILAIISYAQIGLSSEVTLAWDANTEYWLTGYNLYVKEGSSIQPDDSQATVIYIPLSTDGFDPDYPRYTISDLEDDKVYYFVVTARSYGDLESGYSNEVSVINGKLNIEAESSFATNGGCIIDVVTLKRPNE